MIQLPEKPWNEGDTFTNDATGVEYTFDGVKWLASGGEELDLSGFVTDAQLVAVEDASVARDEILDGKIEQESNLNTAAHLKLEDQIQWTDTHWQKGDEKLQEQIDELKGSPEKEPTALGALRWQDFTWGDSNIDSLGGVARFHPDRTKMSLNHDTTDMGRVDWAEAFGDYPATIGIEVEGNTYRAVINFTGTAGTNSRGKNFEIVESNLPDVVSYDAPVTFYDCYAEPSVNVDDYATKEYVDGAIDAIEIPEAGGKQMFSTTVFGTASNSGDLDDGDWHFTYMGGQSTVVGDNAEGLVYKINARDWWKDKCELTGLGYVVVSSKEGFVYWGGHVKDGEFNDKGELVLDLPRSQRQTSGGTATLGTTCRIDFYNVFREK